MHLRVEIILYFPTETDIKFENHCSKLCILVSVYYYKSCVSVEVLEWVYGILCDIHESCALCLSASLPSMTVEAGLVVVCSNYTSY